MKNKKQIRENFRSVVFARDNFKCVFCGEPAVDAHHITDRNSPDLMHGGYIIENGISVCDEHHIMCEKFHITNGEEWHYGFHPNDLYKRINSSKELAIKIDSKC